MAKKKRKQKIIETPDYMRDNWSPRLKCEFCKGKGKIAGIICTACLK